MVIPRKVVKSIVDNEFLKVNPLNPDVAVGEVYEQDYEHVKAACKPKWQQWLHDKRRVWSKRKLVQRVPNDWIAWTTIYKRKTAGNHL